jgi:adenylate cyclase
MSTRIPIRFKLAALFGLVAGGLTLVFSLIVLDLERQALVDQMISLGGTITTELARHAKTPLLQEDTLALNLLVQELKKGDGVVEALVLDRDLRIRGASRVERVGEVYGLPAALDPKGLDRRAMGRLAVYPDPPLASGHSTIAFLSPVTFSDLQVGYALVAFARSLIDARVAEARRRIFLVGTLLGALGLAASLYLARRVSRPIVRLAEGSQSIARGDIAHRIEPWRVGGPDELSDLVDAFNDMAEALRQKELIKGAFSRYVGHQIVEEVLKEPDRTRLAGRRQVVSVLFADICGFTALSERMDPERVLGILNEFFGILTEIIHRFRGTVDKFMGDSIMAVFGSPGSVPDHALRAVMAAVCMQKMVAHLNAQRQARGEAPVIFRIGVNTGEVIVGNLGSDERMEFAVIGDPVNVAHRLQGITPGGSVYITDATFRQVQDIVVAQPHPAESVRGRQRLVSILEVLDLTGDLSRDLDAYVEQRLARLGDTNGATPFGVERPSFGAGRRTAAEDDSEPRGAIGA